MKKTVALLLLAVLMLSLVACGAGETRDVSEYRTTMEFHEDFRILQLADLHFGIETDHEEKLDLIRERIRREEPDLIILTGDNFMYASEGTVRTLIEVLNEECRLLSESRPERLTKFAMTFGNHDNQGTYDGYLINRMLLSFVAPDGQERAQGKYAAFLDVEGDSVYGNANYFIDLVDDPAKVRDEVNVLYRLYIIDSNSYHFLGFKYGYDVIHEDQLSHVERIAREATADGDYIGLAFFHIPFAEYTLAQAQYAAAPDPSLVGQGEWREKIHQPYENNGAFARLRAAGILGFFVGHDHRNYGEILYREENGRLSLFSYGVKSTDQLYHDDDMMGYKVITLSADLTAEEFLSIENVRENFNNVREGE